MDQYSHGSWGKLALADGPLSGGPWALFGGVVGRVRPKALRILTTLGRLWESYSMETKVTIDDDLLEVAKNLAQVRSVSLGRVLTDLARQGLASASEFDRRPETGFPMFRVSPESRSLSIEDMRRVEDED